jgi:hypothetical protein
MDEWHWNLLIFSEITNSASGMPINIVSDIATDPNPEIDPLPSLDPPEI